MTQTVVITSVASNPPPTPVGASIVTTTDDAILTTGWSTPIAVADLGTFTVTPAAGGSILVQFSADNVNWIAASSLPYTATSIYGVPPYALWIRAMAKGGTGTLVVVTPSAYPTAAWSDSTGTALVRPDASRAYVADGGAMQAFFDRQLSVNGAVFNGTADDWAAVQTSLNAVMAQNWYGRGAQNTGSRLFLPDGRCGLATQLQIPTRVWIIGRGARGGTSFEALSSFAQGSATFDSLIKLGREVAVSGVNDNGPVDCGISYAAIASFGRTDYNVVSSQIQEGCGLEYVLMAGATVYNWYVPTDNNANFSGKHLEIYPWAGATSGIHMLSPGGKITLSDITVVGDTTLTNGLYLSGGCFDVSGVHVETCTHGIYLNGGASKVSSVDGPVGATVTNLITTPNIGEHQLINLVKNSATNVLNETDPGKTFTDTSIPIIGGRMLGRCHVYIPYAASSSGGAIGLNSTYGSYYNVNTLTENTTVGSPSNYVEGQEIIARFTQDGTGGRTVAWNAVFKNVITSSGTANQKALVKFFYDGTNYWPVGGTLTATGALQWTS